MGRKEPGFPGPDDSRPVTAPDGRFYPVPLENLLTEWHAPCDLFRRMGPEEYVFFAGKGVSFSREIKEGLVANGVLHLYIRDEEACLYFDYLRDVLGTLVRDPHTDSRKKAALVYSACQEILKKVFQDPRASFINQAHELIGPTVELIVSDDWALRGLIQLTAHDHRTYVHSTNVGIFSVALARILYGNDAAHDMGKLGVGFFLHDLGKCRIPLDVLNKPGALSPEEREIVNLHPEDGHRILAEGGFLTDEARIIVLQHHEREDGQGYPAGLVNDRIHPYARICRLADVYEALTSDRPYHTRHTTFEALKLMKQKLMADMPTELMDHFIRLFMP